MKTLGRVLGVYFVVLLGALLSSPLIGAGEQPTVTLNITGVTVDLKELLTLEKMSSEDLVRTLRETYKIEVIFKQVEGKRPRIDGKNIIDDNSYAKFMDWLGDQGADDDKGTKFIAKGINFPEKGMENRPLEDRDVMLISPDARRLGVVHELLHCLIQRQRIKNGLPKSILEASLRVKAEEEKFTELTKKLAGHLKDPENATNADISAVTNALLHNTMDKIEAKLDLLMLTTAEEIDITRLMEEHFNLEIDAEAGDDFRTINRVQFRRNVLKMLTETLTLNQRLILTGRIMIETPQDFTAESRERIVKVIKRTDSLVGRLAAERKWAGARWDEKKK